MDALRAAMVLTVTLKPEADMADLIFVALTLGLFTAFAAFAAALRRV